MRVARSSRAVCTMKKVTKKRKSNAGRKTVMTEEVLAKLEHAFSVGASDREAIFYAGIGKDSLYDYQKEHPEFTERKEALKETPILKAKMTIVQGLGDSTNAKWYLERKVRDEFSPSEKIDLNANHNIRFEVVDFEK